MTIVRVGTNRKYAAGWEAAFGGKAKKKAKSAAKKGTAKKTSTAKAKKATKSPKKKTKK